MEHDIGSLLVHHIKAADLSDGDLLVIRTNLELRAGDAERIDKVLNEKLGKRVTTLFLDMPEITIEGKA